MRAKELAIFSIVLVISLWAVSWHVSNRIKDRVRVVEQSLNAIQTERTKLEETYLNTGKVIGMEGFLDNKCKKNGGTLCLDNEGVMLLNMHIASIRERCSYEPEIKPYTAPTLTQSYTHDQSHIENEDYEVFE